jgi:hypothetical protein
MSHLLVVMKVAHTVFYPGYELRRIGCGTRGRLACYGRHDMIARADTEPGTPRAVADREAS